MLLQVVGGGLTCSPIGTGLQVKVLGVPGLLEDVFDFLAGLLDVAFGLVALGRRP